MIYFFEIGCVITKCFSKKQNKKLYLELYFDKLIYYICLCIYIYVSIKKRKLGKFEKVTIFIVFQFEVNYPG